MAALEHIFRKQMAATLAHLRQGGFEPPLYCAFIDRTGSTVCGRYEEKHGRRELAFTILSSHMLATQFALPINVMLVNQRGEAAHVALNCPEDSGTVLELN
jgi:hypothetical protein